METGLEWLAGAEEKPCLTSACIQQLQLEKLCEIAGEGVLPGEGSTNLPFLGCAVAPDGTQGVLTDPGNPEGAYLFTPDDGSDATLVGDFTGYVACDQAPEPEKQIVEVGKHTVWCVPVFACIPDGDFSQATFWSCNPETEEFETVNKATVGQNPLNNVECFSENCPFEVLSDGSPIDLALLQAEATGLPIPGAFVNGVQVVFDPALHALSGYHLEVGSLGDEVGVNGDPSTTCSAKWTKGGKTRDLEPGGAAADDKPNGVEVLPFDVTPVVGTAIVGEICVSACINRKTGEAVPKVAVGA